MLEIFLDSLLDSLKIFIIVLIFYILLSFIENKISRLLENKKISPFLGALFGLIPQCGFSVVASDLYLKRHITMGTLLAVFIACSDEALLVLLSSIDKITLVLPLILIKFIIAFIIGFLIDFIISKKESKANSNDDEFKVEKQLGCCHHFNKKEIPFHQYFIHPLIHSLKIFASILLINFGFGILIYYVGLDNITTFLTYNKYLSPLAAVLIGLIPNCASSVALANLFILDAIPFGSCLAGLIVNAGLGIFYLFKAKNQKKEIALIIIILISVGLISGYVSLLFI